MKLVLSLLIASLSSNLALADGTSLPRECQVKGPIEVCRSMQDFADGAIQLDIAYNGSLVPPYSAPNPWKRVSAWVQVNYRDESRHAVFAMERGGMSERVVLTNGCLRMGAYCKVFATPEMRHLLYWTVNPPYRLNELDLEVAIVDENGLWDSNYGQNYRFRFAERAR